MAGKSKFQILKTLNDRINKLTTCTEECDEAFQNLDHAFILGVNYLNITNYLGLTTDYKLHNNSNPVTGIAYFKSSPDEQQIQTDLQPTKEFFYSQNGLGSHVETDKNEHLYLVYCIDKESKLVVKKLFNINNGKYLEAQPKFSVLDETKIYAHSALCKIEVCLGLNLYDDCGNLLPSSNIVNTIDEAKTILTVASKEGLSLTLKKSNFSSNNPLSNKNSLESLYASLDIPENIEQMGDYLPQMNKEEKKKIRDKWRNKVRDQRTPFEFVLEHDKLSVKEQDDNSHAQCYRLNLSQEFMYLQVNDSIAKCNRVILFALRQKLESIVGALSQVPTLGRNDIKSCTFRLPVLGHHVPAVYILPKNPDYQKLEESRKELHNAYLIPYDKPQVRYAQRVMNLESKNDDEQNGYLCNVHLDIMDKSGIKGGTKSILAGTYTYHHYLQDRAQDSGWGCAYRSLQTVISWFKHQAYIYSPDIEPREPKTVAGGDKSKPLRDKLNLEARVPTHEEIQSVLVDIGDKQPSFIGSQKWIGSQEVCYVLNHLYDLDSKFISVSSGEELVYKARDLGQHFQTQSTPVMIGGGVLAHTIIGVDFNEKNGDVSYLILDPHYTGAEDLSAIMKKGWCGWKKNAFWDKSSFYNLCLPQRPTGI